MSNHHRVLAWLGQWRDKIPPEAVTALQNIVAPLPDVSGDSFASAEEIAEFDAIARLRSVEERIGDSLLALVRRPLGEFRGGIVGGLAADGLSIAVDGHAAIEQHQCDKSGPMVPVNGVYVFTCSKCGGRQ